MGHDGDGGGGGGEGENVEPKTCHVKMLQFLKVKR
jgi:hypothetical protein